MACAYGVTTKHHACRGVQGYTGLCDTKERGLLAAYMAMT